MNRTARIAVGAAAAGAGLLAAYLKLVRPWALRWGATEEEAARPLPGDEVVAKADYVATRAITIDAPPHQVWPWLVQIGSGRAGWYTYDRLDNAGMPSATQIIPELQQLQVGDLIPMVVGKDIGVRVKELEPDRRMLWWDEKGEYSWSGYSSRRMAEPGCSTGCGSQGTPGPGRCCMSWWPPTATS